MEGQQSEEDNSNARAQLKPQSQSQDESNNINQTSPTPNNQAPSIPPIQEEEAQNNDSNVDTNSRKRKLTSVIWNHFEKVKVNGEDKAECHYCKKKLGANSKNGTRHLHDHFKSCPMRTCRDIRQQVLGMGQKTADGQTDFSCIHFDPEKSRKDLAEMVMVHEYQLVMVEHHEFRKFVAGLQPLFKVPSRNTLKNNIIKIYDFEKQKTMRIMEKNQSKIAITTDMWTSSNQKKGFMSITTHFIDDNWEMQSRIMRFSLSKWSEDQDETIKAMAERMLGKFDKYWSVIHGVMGVAAVLDPRYKLKIMEFAFPKLYGFDKSDGEIVKLKELVYRLFQDYETSCQGSSRNRDGVDSSRNTSDGDDGFFNDYFTFVEEDSHTGTTSELDHYLQEKIGKQNVDFDILSWWKTNGFKYPTLQKIARDILAIPISTVASKSVFNTSGRLVSPHRSRLHPKTLEALMCAQSWLINEIRATCSQEFEAYCKSIEYDHDDSDESGVTTA